jgi:hypothetical protein
MAVSCSGQITLGPCSDIYERSLFSYHDIRRLRELWEIYKTMSMTTSGGHVRGGFLYHTRPNMGGNDAWTGLYQVTKGVLLHFTFLIYFSIATGYGLHDPRGWNSSPSKAKNFLQVVHTACAAHPAYPLAMRGSFPRGKASRAWNWPLTQN